MPPRDPNPKKQKPLSRHKQDLLNEEEEISLLESWIESKVPGRGTKAPAKPPGKSPDSGEFGEFFGRELFDELPVSNKMKRGLRASKFVKMSDIQRESVPHSICGRDILGAAQTGSGKTLAFLIPVLEKLYKARWGREDGVGCIILSPTTDLAGQIYEVLNKVGRYHDFSAGLLVGKRKGVDDEKERINTLNILVCTPGRLLQHMDETPNFDCSQLQVLVLDEADQILEHGFKQQVDAIISQLPRSRQTLLFSATQTKSIKDLARVSLKNPEYINVHEESATATPKNLMQFAMVVPLEQKLNTLWSFIRRHLTCKTLVFLSSVKQVKFVYEVFKKLRPGIPLKCIHGRMKFPVQQAIIADFNETTSVLFSTDISSRGLDFPKVDWVVQVDCPESIEIYIHRVGRTARYNTRGRALIFLCPEEAKMLEKLKSVESKIPIEHRKPREEVEDISTRVASLLVQFPNLQQLAKKAFITYLKSIHKQKDKEVFDLSRLFMENFAAFAASLGLPVTPKIRFIGNKMKKQQPIKDSGAEEHINSYTPHVRDLTVNNKMSKEEPEDDVLYPKKSTVNVEPETVKGAGTRVLKNKKLKINIHRPAGTRFRFDEDGNVIPPLASIAEAVNSESVLDTDKVKDRYAKLKEELQEQDKEDKIVHREHLREKRREKKMKLKRRRGEEEAELEAERMESVASKRKKIQFESESEDDQKGACPGAIDKDYVAKQEALALKLLSSIHKDD